MKGLRSFPPSFSMGPKTEWDVERNTDVVTFGDSPTSISDLSPENFPFPERRGDFRGRDRELWSRQKNDHLDM